MASRRNLIDRRKTSATAPFDFAELERLRTQSAAARSSRQPTAPIVDESDEPEMPRPSGGRAATVADPMTMSVLAEIERLDHETDPEPEPAPPRRDSNVHIKPRSG